MIRWTIRFSLALVLGVATSTLAQIPIDQDDLLEDASVFSPNWFAEMQDVEIQGDFAYVFGVGGLAIFDLTYPDFPMFQDRYQPPGHPYNRYYRGAVNGDLACGGAREDRLAIFDVSDPLNIDFLTLHGTSGMSYEGAAIQGDFIYACRHGNGMEVVDVSNPLSPFTVAVVSELTNAWDVEMFGQHAFVADGSGGLVVVDVTSPSAPVVVASAPTSGAAVDVDVNGALAVVCTGSKGFDIFNVVNPAAPVLVGSANTSGLAITAVIAGTKVYVADWDDVEVFDISTPSLPTLVGGEDTPVRAMGLGATDDLVVVADWSKMRVYRTGPTTRGDIHVTNESINFGGIPVGDTVDTVFTIGNTGGGAVNVDKVEVFDTNFTVLDPGPFTIPAGGTQDVGISFYHSAPGYDATFIKITSDDTDEDVLTFPLQADDRPLDLAIGDVAPAFTHTDLDGVQHSLSDYRGRVVVMAFFANW
jgi:hypothetical protein